jgi:hypothetical protein
VLKRVTADGIHIYPTRTLWQIERAKDQIGPFRSASLEIFRPGQGLIYLWVEFLPVGGAAACKEAAPMKARIQTEQELPGARALFQGVPSNGNAGGGNSPGPGFPGGIRPPQPHNSAASLFGR